MGWMEIFRSERRGFFFALISLAALLAAGLGAGGSEKTPPLPVDSGRAQDFSVDRAMEHVRRLAREPRPLGSAAHGRARDYIAGVIQSYGLHPEIQAADAVRPSLPNVYMGGYIQNIIAVLPGSASGPENGKKRNQILLVAHYDSAPVSLGAADDAAGVAVLLELMRILRSDPPRSDVLFLFSDGEEMGLLGAQEFVESHPRAKFGGFVVNLEARGNRGPSAIFEIHPPRREMMRAFVKYALRPRANSLSQAVYKILPNDSDFSIFRQAGFNGLNFAFYENVSAYHSRTDSWENLSRRSVYHHGRNALAAVRAADDRFADKNVPFAPGSGISGREKSILEASDAYFNYPGFSLIYYSRTISGLLTLGTLLLFAFLYWRGARRGLYDIFAPFRWSIFFILGGALSCLLLLGANYGLQLIKPELSSFTFGEPYRVFFFRAGHATLAVAWAVFLMEFARRRVNSSAAYASIGLIWAGQAGLAFFFFPGAEYILQWPLLFSLPALLLLQEREREATSPASRQVRFRRAFALLAGGLFLVCGLAAVLLFAETYADAFPGFTLRLIWLLAPTFVFSTALLWPLFEELRRTAGGFLFLAPLVAALLFFSLGLLRQDFHSGAPLQNSIFYARDANSGEALWASCGPRVDSFTARFLGENPGQADLSAHFPLIKNCFYTMRPFLAKKTRGKIVRKFRHSIRESRIPEGRLLHLRLRIPPGADMLYFFLRKNQEIRGFSFNRRILFPNSIRREPKPGHRIISGIINNESYISVNYAAPRGRWIFARILLDPKSKTPVRFRAAYQKYGLPVFFNAEKTRRPSGFIPAPSFPFIDSFLVSREFEYAIGSRAAK